MFVWLYVRSHILCTQLVICLLSHFIHIWYLVWTSCVHKMCDWTYGKTNMKRAILSQKSTFREIGIICACSDHGQPRYQIWIKCDKKQMTSCVHKMCERTYGQTNMFVFCWILFIFGVLVGHDLSMRIIYRFHGWLIFARGIALFMFVWPYVRSHILCTQLVVCLLSHFIHIWYLDWPWSEHAHIIPISRMVD
jgi:hypothetical protein